MLSVHTARPNPGGWRSCGAAGVAEISTRAHCLLHTSSGRRVLSLIEASATFEVFAASWDARLLLHAQAGACGVHFGQGR